MQDKVLVAPRNINGAGEAGDQKETNLKKRSPYSGRVAIPVAKRQYTEGWDYPPGLDKPKRYSSEPRYYEKKRGKKFDQNFKTYDIYRFDVFKYAYECTGDTGASYMYRAFRHARDLGFTQEQVISLVEDICEYRGTDFDAIMKRTGMLNQINRSYQL